MVFGGGDGETRRLYLGGEMRMIGMVIRIGGAIAAVVVSAASATAPSKHNFQKSASIDAAYEDTWSAVIDVFAEHNWPITTMAKDSGLITADWMRLDHAGYTDCGGSGLASELRSQVLFNVRVKNTKPVELTVNALFRQERSLDDKRFFADCESKGVVERLVLSEVARRASGNVGSSTPNEPDPPNPTGDPKKARAFWCDSQGRCTVAASTCAGACDASERAWCVPTADGFVCGTDRDACLKEADRSRSRQSGECVQRVAGKWAGPVTMRATKAATPTPNSAPAAPRGFFCANSPTQPNASVCTREKRDCETAADAIAGAVADIGKCTLVETAHCFDAGGRERCFPTAETCGARANGATCNERK